MKKEHLELSEKQEKWEDFYGNLFKVIGFLMILLLLAFLLSLFLKSWPSIKQSGFSFLWGKKWNPVKDKYGAFPFLLGTLLTSFISLFISIPFSLSLSLFLGEYYPVGWFSETIKSAIELIAGIPSIIFGFWGLFILVPLVRFFEILFKIPPYGLGVFTASLVLSIMIIPYSASLGINLIRLVPKNLKEGAYALGATRWEIIKILIWPITRKGLFSGILLSFGRALGETMVVTMLIGNASSIATHVVDLVFGPGNTMASVIANEFAEADHPLYLSALMEIGLLLFVITLIINYLGKKFLVVFSHN